MNNLEEKIAGKFTIVIPAYNEEKTVNKVVEVALKVKEKSEKIHEVILVNDGSTDKTAKIIADLPIRIITHKKNMGYTAAISSGIHQTKTEFAVIIDADWQNITPQAIEKILEPIIQGKAELVKASFVGKIGRVTNFAVKPMMKILYPDYEFEQPISGQFAGPTEFFESVEIDNSWGIAIGILLEALQQGLRVIEVDVGKLEHKARSDEEKAEMAQQVMETMIRKAGLIQHKYKLVVFTLGNTLVPSQSLNKIFAKLAIDKNVAELQEKLDNGKITFEVFAKRAAFLFKGLDTRKVEDACRDIPLVNYASEVIKALKRRRFQVAIISSNFSPIVHAIAKNLGVELVDCISLESNNFKLNGNVAARSGEYWLGKNQEESFERALIRIIQRAKVKPLETMMVANSPRSIPLFLKAGFAVAFRPQNSDLREIADKTISILPEILAIIE